KRASRPALPIRTSLPGPPISRSLPSLPVRRSSPGPPSKMAVPPGWGGPPEPRTPSVAVSLPAPPKTTATPVLPTWIRSSPGPAVVGTRPGVDGVEEAAAEVHVVIAVARQDEVIHPAPGLHDIVAVGGPSDRVVRLAAVDLGAAPAGVGEVAARGQHGEHRGG